MHMGNPTVSSFENIESRSFSGVNPSIIAPPAENGDIPVDNPPRVMQVYSKMGFRPVTCETVAITGKSAGATTPTKLPPKIFKTAAIRHSAIGTNITGILVPTQFARSLTVPACTATATNIPMPEIISNVFQGTFAMTLFSSPR